MCVCMHLIGLTPQGIGVLGGFRAQGRTAVKAKAIVGKTYYLLIYKLISNIMY